MIVKTAASPTAPSRHAAIAIPLCALMAAAVACGDSAGAPGASDTGADTSHGDALDTTEATDTVDVLDTTASADVAETEDAADTDAASDVADADADAADTIDDSDDGDDSDGSDTPDTADASDVPDQTDADDRLAALLSELDADVDAALCAHQAPGSGWPIDLGGTYLFVSLDPDLDQLAGDFNLWVPEPMTARSSYHYAVRSAAPGDQYKFTDGSRYEADWRAHSYIWDSFGQMSVIGPTAPAFSRYLLRTVDCGREARIWNPGGPITHVMFAHDGQNLFDRGAVWGGWRLDESTPVGMLVVGLDNTRERITEYTQVVDLIGGVSVGGGAETYRAVFDGLVAEVLDDPALALPDDVARGIMGSSLGGLVSIYIALQEPGAWDFVASLSGTIGWGSLELDGATILDLVAAADDFTVPVYLDSGGGAESCVDSDADGVNDDSATNADNYCENIQLRDLLAETGRTFEVDLWHWHEPGAAHNEAAWAARVFRPLELFASL